jgi:hypothetical protein
MDFIGDIDLVGLLSVVIFYLLILGVGMWAAGKKSHVEGVSEEVGTISPFENRGDHLIPQYYLPCDQWEIRKVVF